MNAPVADTAHTTTRAANIVEAIDVRKTYGEGHAAVEALRGATLSIRPGEFVAIMGPSGSGKSTLLHLLGALDAPTAGRILLEGRDLAALSDDARTLLRRRRIGFVFQAFNLLPVLTAAENVAVPLTMDGMGESDARARAADALARVGLPDRGGHFPAELSGGEQQRVAIARAIVHRPALLLADEPTGNLDRATGDQIMSMLRQLVQERGQTLVIVTHDPHHAAQAHRVIELADGRIVRDGRAAATAAPPGGAVTAD